MLSTFVHVKDIPFDLPLIAIMRRLGGKMSDSVQTGMVIPVAERVFAECRPSGLWGELSIVDNDGNMVDLSDGTRIDSKSVAGFLSGATRCWLGVVTIGTGPLNIVRQYVESDDGANALIADAAASECVEAAMESMQAMASLDYQAAGVVLDHRRFSCGFGGWRLEEQRHYFEWLPLQEKLQI